MEDNPEMEGDPEVDELIQEDEEEEEEEEERRKEPEPAAQKPSKSCFWASCMR